VKENGRTHDEGTEKGRANNAALDEIAKTWNNLSAEQQNNTALADRVRESFIKTAMDAGRLREAAEKLANAELEIPTDIGINITQTGALTATKQAKDLRTALLKIPRITETTIRTIQETFILPPKSKSDRTQTLEEMLGGRRKASGGYISGPGGPRDDAIPAWLSNGEYVINAAATRANLPLLHEINSERFAGGGLASRYSGGPDYSRARPMSGGYAPNVAPAPSQPVAVRMSSGALEIKGGKAYVEGIADVLYSTRKDWESTRVRASGR
jgi:hypothetical protein